MNKIISLIFALTLLVSCGQVGNNKTDIADQELKPVTVSEILGDASAFVDEPVKISGTVVHVCRHGGQRLFIIGEEGEERVRITTGEDIAEFDVSLEGETIEVAGIVKELIIDETYLAEWEAEVLEGSTQGRGEGHEGGVGHGDDHGEAGGEHAEVADHDNDAAHAEGADHDNDAAHAEGADHDNDAEHAEGAEHDNDAEHAEGEDSDTDEDEAAQNIKNQLAKIQGVRDEIASSGKDHLSDYWIETIEYKVIEE